MKRRVASRRSGKKAKEGDFKIPYERIEAVLFFIANADDPPPGLILENFSVYLVGLVESLAPALQPDAALYLEDDLLAVRKLMEVLAIEDEKRLMEFLTIIQPEFEKAWNESRNPLAMLMVAEAIIPPIRVGDRLFASPEIRAIACDLATDRTVNQEGENIGQQLLVFTDSDEPIGETLIASLQAARAAIKSGTPAKYEAMLTAMRGAYRVGAEGMTLLTRQVFAGVSLMNGLYTVADYSRRISEYYGAEDQFDLRWSYKIRKLLGTPPPALLLESEQVL